MFAAAISSSAQVNYVELLAMRIDATIIRKVDDMTFMKMPSHRREWDDAKWSIDRFVNGFSDVKYVAAWRKMENYYATGIDWPDGRQSLILYDYKAKELIVTDPKIPDND